MVNGINPKSGQPFTGNLIAFIINKNWRVTKPNENDVVIAVMDLEIDQEESCIGLDRIKDEETRKFIAAYTKQKNDFYMNIALEKLFIFGKKVKQHREISFTHNVPTVVGTISCDADVKQNGQSEMTVKNNFNALGHLQELVCKNKVDSGIHSVINGKLASISVSTIKGTYSNLQSLANNYQGISSRSIIQIEGILGCIYVSDFKAIFDHTVQ